MSRYEEDGSEFVFGGYYTDFISIKVETPEFFLEESFGVEGIAEMFGFL